MSGEDDDGDRRRRDRTKGSFFCVWHKQWKQANNDAGVPFLDLP